MNRLLKVCVLLAGLSTALSATAGPGPAPEYLTSPRLPPGLPFSEAVRIGNLYYLSGMIGDVPGKMALVPGGIREQAAQTMDNIGAVLAANGLGFDDVVKCTAMLADITEWAAFNEVYRTYFKKHFPARSAFGTTGLVLGARVELECIAVRHD